MRHESFRDSEFFDPEDLLQVKCEMLRQVEVDKQPVSQAAKTFGFSRPSFYQAQAAFQDSGLVGLLPHKRGPRSGAKLRQEQMQLWHNSNSPSQGSPVPNWPTESQSVSASRFTSQHRPSTTASKTTPVRVVLLLVSMMLHRVSKEVV